MPNSAKPTLAVLRDQIKTEARVKGADNLDGFIDGLVNELLLDYAQKNRYFEFLVTNATIATVLATGQYSLPADFMNPRLVRFKSTNGYTRSLSPRSHFVDTALGRRPRYYEASGSNILVFPYDDVADNETLLIDYYKVPDTLTANDPFPVMRLLPSVKLESIHRVLIFNNQMAQAAALKGEAQENEVRSKPSG